MASIAGFLTTSFKRPLARTLAKGGAVAAGIGALGVAGCYAKPFVLAIPYYQRQKAASGDGFSYQADQQTTQRRRLYEQALIHYYLPRGGGKIDWYQLADIVDWVARSSPTDQDFRQDIWHLFGWQSDGQRAKFAQYLDPQNRGLPAELHNSHYQSEQMHHYLGGTTGNTDKIPSHLINNPVYALLYELKELPVTGNYNWGDVRLFNLSQKHRDDFLKHGRMTVAPNIRSLLIPPARTNLLPFHTIA